MHESSIGLLRLLKEKRESLVTDLKEQIAATLKEIEARSAHPAYESFDKILTGRVTTYEKDTLERKIHKLQRDRGDYHSGNIKFWQNKRQGSSHNNNNHNIKKNYPTFASTVRMHPIHKSLNKVHTHSLPETNRDIFSPGSSFKNRTYTNTRNKYINTKGKNRYIKCNLYLQLSLLCLARLINP